MMAREDLRRHWGTASRPWWAASGGARGKAGAGAGGRGSPSSRVPGWIPTRVVCALFGDVGWNSGLWAYSRWPARGVGSLRGRSRQADAARARMHTNQAENGRIGRRAAGFPLGLAVRLESSPGQGTLDQLSGSAPPHRRPHAAAGGGHRLGQSPWASTQAALGLLSSLFPGDLLSRPPGPHLC